MGQSAWDKQHHGPDYPDATYIQHAYPEALFDTGEVILNYAVTGSDSKSALLLIPPQAASWWGYERAMKLLVGDFQVFTDYRELRKAAR